MDYKLLKKTAETINMPEYLADEILQNCQSPRRKRSSVKIGYRLVAASLVLVILTTVLAIWKPWQEVSVYATDLMEGIVANPVETKEADEEWIRAVADFSVELFQKGQTTNENSLISPMSVYLALAMAANGAGGETLEAFEQVLGDGISIEDINMQAYSLLSRLCYEDQETLKINNSVWFDKANSGAVYQKFLQKNADYYGAGAFYMNVRDENDTIEKMNQWISEATAGKLQKVVETIDANTALMLINTILFESSWKKAYVEPENKPFQNFSGEWVNVPMLEGIKQYIENENAIGFINPYYDEKYSFVALLPREGMTLEEYVNNLTGEELLNIINLETQETCLSYLPELRYEYEMDLAGALKNMGLGSVFGSNSDFSNMIEAGKTPGGLGLSKVNHKTFIQLDQYRTRAGAVTVEVIPTRGGIFYPGPNYVFLNRPFLYAIIDNETKLPIFLGTVNQLEGDVVDAPDYGTFLQESDGVTYRVTKGMTNYNYASVVMISASQKKITIPWFVSSEISGTPGAIVSRVDAFICAENQTIEEVKFYWSIDGKLLIEKGAFSNCPNLKKVIFESYDGGVFATIAEDAFEGSENVVFYIREGMYSKEIQEYAKKHSIPIEFYTETAE